MGARAGRVPEGRSGAVPLGAAPFAHPGPVELRWEPRGAVPGSLPSPGVPTGSAEPFPPGGLCRRVPLRQPPMPGCFGRDRDRGSAVVGAGGAVGAVLGARSLPQYEAAPRFWGQGWVVAPVPGLRLAPQGAEGHGIAGLFSWVPTHPGTHPPSPPACHWVLCLSPIPLRLPLCPALGCPGGSGGAGRALPRVAALPQVFLCKVCLWCKQEQAHVPEEPFAKSLCLL